MRRLHSSDKPSDNPFVRAVEEVDEQYDLPSMHLVSLYLKDAAKRDDATVRLVLLDAAIAAVVGPSLWIVWVWFGGRTKPGGPATKSEASA